MEKPRNAKKTKKKKMLARLVRLETVTYARVHKKHVLKLEEDIDKLHAHYAANPYKPRMRSRVITVKKSFWNSLQDDLDELKRLWGYLRKRDPDQLERY